MDNLTPEKRSRIMKAVKSSNTKPELAVRRLLHAAGYRYRLHAKGLPGCPDLVFSSRRKAIFVHGCFWHVHKRCGGRIPDSALWQAKLLRNVERDREAQIALRKLGWSTLVVWECEINGNSYELLNKLTAFIDP